MQVCQDYGDIMERVYTFLSEKGQSDVPPRIQSIFLATAALIQRYFKDLGLIFGFWYTTITF